MLRRLSLAETTRKFQIPAGYSDNQIFRYPDIPIPYD